MKAFERALTVLVCSSIASIVAGLQCYSRTCTNTSISTEPCSPAVKLTCGKWSDTDLEMDRCTIQRFKHEHQDGNVSYVEHRNCTHSLQCTSGFRDMICKTIANTTSGTLVSCEVGCCDSDLCNDGRVIPTFPPPGPSGADLDCYSCSTIPIPGISVKQAPCSNPTRQNCGGDGVIPNMAQDRCISIKFSAGIMGSYEIRNCSSQSFCISDLMCKSMNSSGTMTSCDVSCCSGSYCNGVAAGTLCSIWNLVAAFIAVKMCLVV